MTASKKAWLGWSLAMALLLPTCYLVGQPCPLDCKEVFYNINADGSCWEYQKKNCQIQANMILNGQLSLTIWAFNPPGGYCTIVYPYEQIVASQNVNNTCWNPCPGQPTSAEASLAPGPLWKVVGNVFRYFCYQPPPQPAIRP